MYQAKKMAAMAGVLAAGLVLTAGAEAALVNRGGGMVYDSALNITWVADWTAAKTSGYDADGMFNDWQAAKLWADDLVFGGYSDWRLPVTAQPDSTCSAIATISGFPYYGGYGCTGGELGHLFYVDMGGTGGTYLQDQTGQTPQQLANRALFGSAVPFGVYASGTDYVGDSNYTWAFGTEGSQGVVVKTGGSPYFALAVRNGDVASTAAVVPEPQTLALALAALGLAGVMRRRGVQAPQPDTAS